MSEADGRGTGGAGWGGGGKKRTMHSVRVGG